MKQRGFTLLELLVVMVIIGLLAGYVGPRFFSQIGKSEVSTTKAQIDAFEKGLDQYRIDVGQNDKAHVMAQIIRADAEAEAAKTYAASFGKDADFYDFYRAMQSYDITFAGKEAGTTILLSPDNAYLRRFEAP